MVKGPITKRSPMELDNIKFVFNPAERRGRPNSSHGRFVGRLGRKVFLISFPNTINCLCFWLWGLSLQN